MYVWLNLELVTVTVQFLTESKHVRRAESRTSNCNCVILYRVNMYIGLNLELVTVTVIPYRV